MNSRGLVISPALSDPNIEQRCRRNSDINDWEFDTIRKTPFLSLDDEYQRGPHEKQFEGSNEPTVRPQQSTNFPSSLRSLFEDSDFADSEGYRLNPTTSESTLHPPLISGDKTTDEVPAHHNSSPPRVANRIPTKPLPNRSKSPMFETHTPSPFDLSVIPQTSPNEHSDNDDVSQATSNSSNVKFLSLLSADLQTTAPEGNDIPKQRDVDLASPSSFQFPHPSRRNLHDGNAQRSIPRRHSPSNSNSVATIHQSTLSLDTSSAINRHELLTPISRSRSATTPPLDTGIEDRITPMIDTKRVPDATPFSSAINRGLPGLKDVLKVCASSLPRFLKNEDELTN